MATKKKAADTVNPGANPSPATTAEASGAVIEKKVASSAVIDHPAVDSNPRDNTTAEMNRIDFNNPEKRQAEAVADNLKKQG